MQLYAVMRYALFLFCFLIGSCGTKPLISTDQLASAKTNNTFWYGSGVVRIDDSIDYQKTARDRALNKIAEQLKVEINSSLIDIQEAYGVGLSAKVSEYNKISIESRVENTKLENVEFIDEMKKTGYYHVVARLNKQQYYARLNKQTDEAKRIALDLILISEQGPSIQTLSNYVSALKAISPYLDKYPEVSYQNRNQKLYPLLLRLFRDYNDRFEIVVSPEKPLIKALIDENVSIFITVTDKRDNSPISDVPIDVGWVGGDESFRIVTNQMGEAKFELDRHWVVDKNQALSFNVSYASFMDSEIELLVGSNPPSKEVNVDVIGPKIFLSQKIINLGNKIVDTSLPSAVKRHFIENYSSEFVSKSKYADLELRLVVSTIEKSKRMNENYPYMIYANGRIEIINIATGEEIFTINLKSKDGDFDSKEMAGIRAIDKLAKKFGSSDLLNTKNK